MPELYSVELLTDFQEMRRYRQLSDEPPYFDLIRNDADHGHRGAHTLERHGPAISLRRQAGAKTIEGRVHGDPPWRTMVTRSYQWTDLRTLNCAVNAYVRQNWTAIRKGLASRHGHDGVSDAGCRVGRGYDGSGVPVTESRQARYREVSQFKVCLRLVPNADPPVPFILSTFPWSNPSTLW